MSELINKFVKHFSTSIEAWEKWKKKNNYNEACLVAGPSRIAALVDLTKLDFDFDWNTYTIICKPPKGMSGNFLYNGHIFSIDLLRRSFNLLKETTDISLYKGALFFRLNETVALAIGGKRTSKDFYYNADGILFEDLEEDESTGEFDKIISTEFVKWNGTVAERNKKGKTLNWSEYIYKFERFFEEEEDMGDFLDL